MKHETHRSLNFAERSGGWVVAICLHVIFMCLLLMGRPQLPAYTPREQPLRIAFVPEPEPEPEVELIEQTIMPEVAAATVPEIVVDEETEDLEYEPAAGIETAEAVEGEEIDTASESYLDPSSRPADSEPEPTRQDDEYDLVSREAEEALRQFEEARLLEEMDQRSYEMDKQNQQTALMGSEEVDQRLRLSRVDQEAQKHLFRSEGLRDGVVRTVETRGVPYEVAQEVLNRYGFRMLIAKVDGSTNTGRGYLSGVATEQGQFVNTAGAGTYQILRYGASAVRHMMRLERDALIAQGYDPTQVRVARVVFAIEPTGGGYDLAVRRLELAPPVSESGEDDSGAPQARRVR